MCRMCGGTKVVYGLGNMPKDCQCTKEIVAPVAAQIAEDIIVDAPQKTRRGRRPKNEQSLSSGL